MAITKILSHLIVIVMVGAACLISSSTGARTTLLEKDDTMEMHKTFFHPFFPPALGLRGGKVIPGFAGGFPSAGGAAGARAGDRFGSVGGSAEGAIGSTGAGIGGEYSALSAFANEKP